MTLPCDPCNQPESCEARGCFKERVSTVSMGHVDGGNNRRQGKPRSTEPPSWEKGVAGEHRPGGGFMPYLKGDSYVGIKEYSENRRKYDAIREQQKQPATTER